jgi:hypothetical protein
MAKKLPAYNNNNNNNNNERCRQLLMVYNFLACYNKMMPALDGTQLPGVLL